MNTRFGVLLITMGDPATVSGVFPYLMKLFMDPLILRGVPGPLRPFIATYISVMKKEAVKEKYQAIGGGSPMDAITKRQAGALQSLLEGQNISVYHSNRYTEPSVQDAYREIKKDGIKKLLALPLYPHFSPAITGSSFDLLKKLMEKDMDPPEVVFHEGFGADPRFISLLAERTKKALSKVSGGGPAQAVFSAHSLPEDLIREGDPYMDNVMQSAAMLQEELGDRVAHVGFQSKGRAGMEWLKPETDEVLKQIAAEGVKGVAVAPISFVSENIETLYDCDILQKSLAESLGVKYARIKNFDDDADFIKFLAELTLEALA
jgi:protoporphyrin/coproporphyrin ferrochelatase